MTESCRLITTEQYQEYLKLKEEHKPISWEELEQKAKDMGYERQKAYTAELSKDLNKESRIIFYEFGDICLSCCTEFCEFSDTFAEDRTPDQMLTIMKALQ